MTGRGPAGTERALLFPATLAARLRLYDGVVRRCSGPAAPSAPAPPAWPYSFLWPYGRGGCGRGGRPAGERKEAPFGGAPYGWLYLR